MVSNVAGHDVPLSIGSHCFDLTKGHGPSCRGDPTDVRRRGLLSLATRLRAFCEPVPTPPTPTVPHRVGIGLRSITPRSAHRDELVPGFHECTSVLSAAERAYIHRCWHRPGSLGSSLETTDVPLNLSGACVTRSRAPTWPSAFASVGLTLLSRPFRTSGTGHRSRRPIARSRLSGRTEQPLDPFAGASPMDWSRRDPRTTHRALPTASAWPRSIPRPSPGLLLEVDRPGGAHDRHLEVDLVVLHSEDLLGVLRAEHRRGQRLGVGNRLDALTAGREGALPVERAGVVTDDVDLDAVVGDDRLKAFGLPRSVERGRDLGRIGPERLVSHPLAFRSWRP